MSGLLRSMTWVFLIGWILWFWMDKSGPVYAMAERFPTDRSLIQALQYGVDLIKSGNSGPAFALLWERHYLILSAVGGLLYNLLWSSIGPRIAGYRNRPERRGKPLTTAVTPSKSEEDPKE